MQVKPINVHIIAMQKPNTLHRKTNDLLKHPVIKAEVKAMQDQARERNQVTIDNVVDELEEARQIAKQSGNAAAMVSATLKTKVLGLVVDKQETNTKILTPHPVLILLE